jgi:hypothetical protein
VPAVPVAATPGLGVNDVSVVEGNAGTSVATFTVSLPPAAGTVTVDYATANDATITAATAIQDAKRDGQTVTVLGCTVVKGGVFRLAATPTVDTLVSAGIPSSITSSVITLPLTGEDLTTELTNATVLSTSVWVQPMTFQVMFAQKALGE